MLFSFLIVVAASLFSGWKLSRGDIFTVASVALCTFVAIGNVALMTALGLRLSKTGLMLVFILLSSLTALTVWFANPASHRQEIDGQIDLSRSAKFMAYFKFGVVLVLALFLAIKFPTVDHSSADTVHHLGIIKKYMDADRLSFDIFSLSAIYPNDIVYFAYAGNTYNPLIGYVSESLNLSPFLVFRVFTVGTLLLLMLGAYHLTYNISEKYSHNRVLSILFLAPVIVVLSVFYPHVPSSYVGYPYLSWAGYPSAFALAATFHVLALLIRFSDILTRDRALIILICAFAAASLHAGFIVGIGAFCITYIALKYALERYNQPSSTQGKSSIVYAVAIIIPLAIALGLKFYALAGMDALDAPNISENNAIPWLNQQSDRVIFNLKAIAHKRLPLYIISLFLLILASAAYSRRGRTSGKLPIYEFAILWAVCFASVAVMYIPVITPFLIDMLSAELMFRTQWIAEAILPVMSLAIIFRLLADLSQQRAKVAKGAAIIFLSLAFGLTVWGGAALFQLTVAYKHNLDGMMERNNLVSITNVKANREYVAFLESLKKDDRYIVTSFSHGQGRHKRIEMTLTRAQLMTPPYTLFDYEKDLTKKCTLHLAQDKPALDVMLKTCRIDYVISYAWPIADSLKGQKRAEIENMQDPLSSIGGYTPTRKYVIASRLPETVFVHVYDVRELSSAD